MKLSNAERKSHWLERWINATGNYIKLENLVKLINEHFFFQPYERMNVADALVTKSYADGDVIIQQVSYTLGRSHYTTGEL